MPARQHTQPRPHAPAACPQAVYLLLPVWTTRVAPALLDFIITRGAPQPARQHAPPYPTHPLGSAAKQLKD